ncbi:MAG: DUF2087 domain-containing protein [Tenericutes bacterium]|nr:DUF2087 domain-containing protein [Mycoplasmatota bacterium]
MFEYSESDRIKVIEGYFISTDPMKLRLLPPKQKKKYIALEILVKILDVNRNYKEKELNEVLKGIYPDFVSIRRGLVDYKFVSREKDGSKYWVNKKD